MSEVSPHPKSSSPAPQPNPPAHAKVLIRAPNWVGDAVMALPALRELRRIFGGSYLTIAARPWVQGLFDSEGLADNFISLDDARGPFSRVTRFISEAGRFRRQLFDFAVLLTNSFGTALAARAGGAKRIAGYATDARRLLLDQVIPFEPDYKSLHQVRYYLNIAAQIECSIYARSNIDMRGGGSEPRLEANEEQKQHARSLLERFNIGVTGENATLVINPGATNSGAKRWPAERFARTADRFNELQGFQTIIVGTAGDTSVAEEVARKMRSPAVVLAGQTSIAELKGLLAWARLVISNDTGTSHVSAALGIPTVVVFGPTEHISTRPLSQRAAVVRHDVSCSPCMLRECPIDHRCMTRVEVDDVYAAAQTLLVSIAG
jgi:heptosyltransferase-2